MEAVEQNPDHLNEIADVARATPADARDAWRVIGECLAEGVNLPDWVKGYLLQVSAKVAGLQDAGSVETLGNGLKWPSIAGAFGFYPASVEGQMRPPKAYYDSLTVFSVIAGWRLEAHNAETKLSLEACFKRYVLERLNDRDHEETVKTAYYRGRAIAEAEIGLLDAIEARER